MPRFDSEPNFVNNEAPHMWLRRGEKSRKITSKSWEENTWKLAIITISLLLQSLGFFFRARGRSYWKVSALRRHAGYAGLDGLQMLVADHGPKDIFRDLPHLTTPLALSHPTSDLRSCPIFRPFPKFIKIIISELPATSGSPRLHSHD